MSDLKDILWEGNSYEDLMSFPQEVRHDFGCQLHLAWTIHENAQFSLAPFAHRIFCSLGNTVRIPLPRKTPCEQSDTVLRVLRDNRTFHE